MSISVTPPGVGGSVESADITDGTIVNADINASAAIAYSKLALTGAILNADISASAAIAYSKLNLTGAILNADLAGSIAYSKLSLTGAVLNADLAGSIAYSKLSLTGAILNADLAGSIAYSKLASMATGNILAGNAGTPTSTTLGGDATIGATGTLTIANGAVTAAKVAADVATQAELDAEASARASADTAAISTAEAYSVQRSNHTGTQTASTVSDFDTQVRTSTLNQMTAPTADLSINTHKLTSVTDGTAATDAATVGQMSTVPTTISAGETFTALANRQVLFAEPIAITGATGTTSGNLAVVGSLIDAGGQAIA